MSIETIIETFSILNSSQITIGDFWGLQTFNLNKFKNELVLSIQYNDVSNYCSNTSI